MFFPLLLLACTVFVATFAPILPLLLVPEVAVDVTEVEVVVLDCRAKPDCDVFVIVCVGKADVLTCAVVPMMVFTSVFEWIEVSFAPVWTGFVVDLLLRSIGGGSFLRINGDAVTFWLGGILGSALISGLIL